MAAASFYFCYYCVITVLAKSWPVFPNPPVRDRDKANKRRLGVQNETPVLRPRRISSATALKYTIIMSWFHSRNFSLSTWWIFRTDYHQQRSLIEQRPFVEFFHLLFFRLLKSIANVLLEQVQMLTHTHASVTIGLHRNKMRTWRLLFIAFSALSAMYVRSMWQIWALNSVIL